jgi:acylphosphatase
MIEHRIIRVTGRVQGVFFRQSAKQKAEALGIVGFARNEPDSTVIIEAEGEPTALDALIAWCHEGPTYAKVERVVVENGTRKHFREFAIR